MMDYLTGRWYLVSSNFPMWKGDDISNVNFNYTPTEKNGEACLLDEVSHLQKGKPKSLVGYDFKDENALNKFTWRGKGWLFFATSKWQVEWMSADKNCMVISFEKSLFSPSGVDILTRQPHPEHTVLEQALSFIERISDLNKKATGQFTILQQ